MILRMFFLFLLNNIDFWFDVRKLTRRSYTAVQILLTISRVQFIDKKEFTKAILNKNSKTFVIYMAILEAKVLTHLL